MIQTKQQVVAFIKVGLTYERTTTLPTSRQQNEDSIGDCTEFKSRCNLQFTGSSLDSEILMAPNATLVAIVNKDYTKITSDATFHELNLQSVTVDKTIHWKMVCKIYNC